MSGLLEDKAHMNNERIENSRLLLTSTNYILLALVTFENTHISMFLCQLPIGSTTVLKAKM